MRDVDAAPPGADLIDAQGASRIYELDGELYCVTEKSSIDPKPPGSGFWKAVLWYCFWIVALGVPAWLIGRLLNP